MTHLSKEAKQTIIKNHIFSLRQITKAVTKPIASPIAQAKSRGTKSPKNIPAAKEAKKPITNFDLPIAWKVINYIVY
mgnify:CR=1 FL=1